MNPRHIKRLKELEEKNFRLKHMYAYLALDNKILKDVIEKAIEPEVKKEVVTEIVTDYDISITRACSLMSIHRSYFYYAKKKNDSGVIDSIIEASEFGDRFWKIYLRLPREGKKGIINEYRVYKLVRFNKRSKLKKRLLARVKQALVIPESPNQTWQWTLLVTVWSVPVSFVY